MNLEDETWTIINSYFRDTQNYLTRHHIDSYNDFIQNKIPLIMKNINIGRRTIFLFDKEDSNITYEIDVYFGGKNYDNFKLAKPTIKTFPEGEIRQLLPNEARLKNLTYGADFFYGVDVDFTIKKGETIILDHVPIQNAPFLQNIYLGKIPIMLQSDLCLLKGATDELLHQMGEDRYDAGGYFILDGQEKVIVSQERKAENIIFLNTVSESSGSEKYTHYAEIKSISDEAFTYSRTVKVQIERNGPITVRLGQKTSFLQEQEGRDVPLFIMFRALGIETDKQIIHYIIGKDLESDLSIKLLNLLRPSVLDPFILREEIYDRESAEAYLAKLPSRAVRESKDKFSEILKNKVSQLSFLYQALEESLFPHCGNDMNIKAYFLGYMTRRLLMLKLGLEKDTDRDNFINKRIDLSGFMISNLFRDAFQQVIRAARVEINSTYTYNAKDYSGDNIQFIINETNFTRIFSSERFKQHFNSELKKGKIGQKIGVVQSLDRLTRNLTLAHLRRIIDNVPPGGKVTIPRRRLHATQYGCVCPCETPEGQKVGLNKGLAILSHITFGSSPSTIIDFLTKNGTEVLNDLQPTEIDGLAKIFVNGNWVGCHRDPTTLVNMFRLFRRNGLINIFYSITWERNTNEIRVLTDNGRFVRPLYIIEQNSLLLQPRHIKGIQTGDINFTDLVAGLRKRKEKYNYYDGNVKDISILGLDAKDPQLYNKLKETQAIVEYIDSQEFDTMMLTRGFDISNTDLHHYTHMELHPSMILSFNAHLLPFMQHNQATRVIYSSKMVKQGITTYAMNFNNRIDTSAHLLNNPEKPLVLGKLHKVLNIDKFGQGHNVVVAVANYNGYNQEDAIIANKFSIDMGLHNTSYYKMYYDTEKVDQKTGEENHFFNPRYSSEIPEYPQELSPIPRKNYDNLDKYGFIKEGTYLDDESQVVIGKYMKIKDERGQDKFKDMSTFVKLGNENSVVDKVYTCQTNKDGHRMTKIRTVQYRKPVIGDKFSSRCAQKGTFGMLTEREDMPYTEDGLVPDFILTPGGYPSRMTVAQLIEILFGNLAVNLGMFGSFNAFETVNVEQVNDILENKLGLTSFGDRVLYNGVTGEQMDVKIFTGVIYYQRLKYMTDDKINTRLSGERENGIPIPGGLYTVKERQSVEGRANGGGLRFGEMERDALVAHGIMSFMKESYNERCDKFEVWVSRHSGEISIANPGEKLFFDVDDGPASYQLFDGTGGKGKTANVQNIIGLNLYGQKSRDFVRLEVPYSFKLLLQEMQGMMMKMRIDTQKLENLIITKVGDGSDDMFTYSVDDFESLLEMDESEDTSGVDYGFAMDDSMDGGGDDDDNDDDNDDESSENEDNSDEEEEDDDEDDATNAYGSSDMMFFGGGKDAQKSALEQTQETLQQQENNMLREQNKLLHEQNNHTNPNAQSIQHQPNMSEYSVPLSGTPEEVNLSQYGGVKPAFDFKEKEDNKVIENLNSQLLGIQAGGQSEEEEKSQAEKIDAMINSTRPQMQNQMQNQMQQQKGQSGGFDMSFNSPQVTVPMTNNMQPNYQAEMASHQMQMPQQGGTYPDKVSFDSNIKVVEIDTKVKDGFLYSGSKNLDPFRS